MTNEGETERESERERERDRDRDRDRERETDRQRERDRQRETERDRDLYTMDASQLLVLCGQGIIPAPKRKCKTKRTVDVTFNATLRDNYRSHEMIY